MVAENQGWCSMVVEKPLKDALLIVLINNFSSLLSILIAKNSQIFKVC